MRTDPSVKNNSISPSWSFTTLTDDIRVVENEFCNFELLWNGKLVATSEHPVGLLRWAYAHKLIDLSRALYIADALGISECHLLDKDR